MKKREHKLQSDKTGVLLLGILSFFVLRLRECGACARHGKDSLAPGNPRLAATVETHPRLNSAREQRQLLRLNAAGCLLSKSRRLLPPAKQSRTAAAAAATRTRRVVAAPARRDHGSGWLAVLQEVSQVARAPRWHRHRIARFELLHRDAATRARRRGRRGADPVDAAAAVRREEIAARGNIDLDRDVALVASGGGGSGRAAASEFAGEGTVVRCDRVDGGGVAQGGGTV